MTSTPPTKEARTAQSRAVLEAYLDALTSGDLEAIAASFTDDVTWSLHGRLPLSGTRRGRQEVVAFLVSSGSLYAPGTQRFSFGDITAEGDRAVLEWRVQGVAAATGKDYDNSYCGIFVIRGGRIEEVREYFDSLHVADTLYALGDIHGEREAIQLEEVPVAERSGILRRFLQLAPGGRPQIPVDRRAPIEDFERIADRYPVFRITPANAFT